MIVFCSIYCVNVFWFNIQPAKKSYKWQFFISMQNVVTFSFFTFFFFFLLLSLALWRFSMDGVQLSQGYRAKTRQFTFLNLGAQIRCSQNRYTDLKSALDQPLPWLYRTENINTIPISELGDNNVVIIVPPILKPYVT